jgi:hypothetical protein
MSNQVNYNSVPDRLNNSETRPPMTLLAYLMISLESPVISLELLFRMLIEQK